LQSRWFIVPGIIGLPTLVVTLLVPEVILSGFSTPIANMAQFVQ